MQRQEITETPSFSAHKNFIICLGQGSVGKVPTTLAQGPEFRFIEPRKSWPWECIYNLSTPVGRGRRDQKLPRRLWLR